MTNSRHGGNIYFEGRETKSASWEMLVSLGEQLQDNDFASVQCQDLLRLTEELISLYDATSWAPFSARERAAHVVATLAGHNASVLELVIRNAELYARGQHIDDAFPYSPNSFEVLAQIRPICDRVSSFLQSVVRHDWGVARWSAMQALQAIQGSRQAQTNSRYCQGAL